jgi:hypothetical protein
MADEAEVETKVEVEVEAEERLLHSASRRKGVGSLRSE